MRGGTGVGALISFHPISSDLHEFLCRVIICVSLGFSLPLKLFPHVQVLHTVNFLDHHTTHRRFKELLHLFEFP